MWPFRKKIEETPKARLYGNRYNSDKNFSAWDSLGFIEKFALIFLPCMLTYMCYIMYESIFSCLWWINAIIAIVTVTLLIVFLFVFISWLTDNV